MQIDIDPLYNIEHDEDEVGFKEAEKSKNKVVRKKLFGKMPNYAGYYLLLNRVQYKKYTDLSEIDNPYSYDVYLSRLCVLFPLDILESRHLIHDRPDVDLLNARNSLKSYSFNEGDDYTETVLRLDPEKVLNLLASKKAEHERIKKCKFYNYFNWQSDKAPLTDLFY